MEENREQNSINADAINALFQNLSFESEDDSVDDISDSDTEVKEIVTIDENTDQSFDDIFSDFN